MTIGNRTARARAAAGLASIAVLAAASARPEVPAPRTRPSVAECGSVTSTESTLSDYRSRDFDAARRWSIADIKHNHYDPAAARMAQGEYSRRVMADIHFLLRGWPNHYPALQLLVQYELAGGKPYEYPTAGCYFARAREYVPDDVNVDLAEGYYYWKKHELSLALESYSDALRIDPESAAAHYNLGLVLLDAGQPSKALAEAHAAYAAGYPLPGLRNKLERAGEWRDAVAGPPTDGGEARQQQQSPH